MKPLMYRTKEGLLVHNKGEEGVCQQQREYKAIIPYFSDRPCGGVWDLGAHVGWFPWYVNKNIQPNPVKILCVECSPRQIKALRLNIPSNAEILQGAIIPDSDERSELTLYLGKTYSSCDSIEQIRGRETVTVPTVKMADIIAALPHPKLVKIDIEGAEYGIDFKKWLPFSVEMVVAELHHQRPGHLELQQKLHKQMISLGFQTDKPPRENPYNRTCHVAYTRKVS